MFHSETELPGNDVHISDPVDHRNNGSDRDTGSGYGIRPRKLNHSPGTNTEALRLRTETMLQNEPDMSSLSLSVSNYSPPKSSNSRTQAIARGREEMMDMVRDLPESFYELSLKDIVEKKHEMDPSKDQVINNVILHEEKKHVVEMAKMNETTQKMIGKRVEKRERGNKSKRRISRSAKSIENEKFLLKTSVIFPLFFGSKKNMSKGVRGNGSGRFTITPKPKQQPIPSAAINGVEKDWWKRRSCMSSESDDSNGLSNSGSSRSSSVSSRSSNSSGRQKNGVLPSFCFFIRRRIKGRKQIHA